MVLSFISSFLLHVCEVYHFPFFSSRDFGIHIDGYIAAIGHTIVVGASKVS